MRFGLYLKKTSSSKLVNAGSTISGVTETIFFPFNIASLIFCFSTVVNKSAVSGLILIYTLPKSTGSLSSPPHVDIDEMFEKFLKIIER